MIWGASLAVLFLLFLLLAVVQLLFLRRYFRKNPPEFSPPSSVNSGVPFSVPLEISLSRVFPGFRILWTCSYGWKEGNREIESSAVLTGGKELCQVFFSSPCRGIYQGYSGKLVLEDLLGFTSLTLYRGDPLTLYVYPGLKEEDFARDVILSGGSTATDARERVRSDELLEVRKYYPGDDARRINWKMFAASGEMFLRIGEEIPPPSGETALSLLCDSPLVASSVDPSGYCDRLIIELLSLARQFYEKGCKVHIGKILYDPEKPDDLLKELAGITAKSSWRLPDEEFFYALAFPGAEGLKKLLEPSAGESGVFLFTPGQREVEGGRWRESLFRKNQLRESLALRRESSMLRDAAESWRDLLKQEGRGRIHVHLL